MISPLTSLQQAVLLLVVSLLVGSMFGIWRGFDPVLYSPATFVEVHQGAVRGLNFLLPAMGIASIVMTGILAFQARKRRQVFWLYVATAVALAVAGVITRFGNQPINDIVMGWTITAPEGWQSLRDTWWTWHLARLAAAFVGEVLLIGAVFAHRSQRAVAPSARLSEVLG